ncbi:MAG: DUF3368 domain-containing protein [Chthoniobacterales bacterium]|nr:DUF3368 domain-containing protein [Chthoniobacterales bacterium]
MLPGDVVLDVGETAAIRLAQAVQADLLLLDERRGRMVAARLDLAVTGTLGVVIEAAMRNLTDFDLTLDLLMTRTNFRVSEAVIAAARAHMDSKRARS